MKTNITFVEFPRWVKATIWLAALVGVIAFVAEKLHGAEAPNRRRAVSSAQTAATKKNDTGAGLGEQTAAFEKLLTDLAGRASNIVTRIPTEPTFEVSDRMRDFRGVLKEARESLETILQQRSAVKEHAERIRGKVGNIRQAWMDLAKKTEARVADIEGKPNANPDAIQSGAKTLREMKTAFERNSTLAIPMRDTVTSLENQADAIFDELEIYPTIFATAEEASELYEQAGDPARYAEIVKNLNHARDNLRRLTQLFIEAAGKADQALRKVPQPPTESTSPVFGPTLTEPPKSL